MLKEQALHQKEKSLTMARRFKNRLNRFPRFVNLPKSPPFAMKLFCHTTRNMELIKLLANQLRDHYVYLSRSLEALIRLLTLRGTISMLMTRFTITAHTMKNKLKSWLLMNSPEIARACPSSLPVQARLN